MLRTRHLATVALVAALAGCGSGEEPAAGPTPAAPTTSAAASPTPSPSPSTSPPPADGGTYDGPLPLVEALNKGGIACTGYQAIANPTGALARGNCHVAGAEYTVGIYKSAAQARQQPNNMAELLDGVAELNIVLGRNWTVGCPDQPTCRSVAEVLGGEVFHEDV